MTLWFKIFIYDRPSSLNMLHMQVDLQPVLSKAYQPTYFNTQKKLRELKYFGTELYFLSIKCNHGKANELRLKVRLIDPGGVNHF